MKPFIYSIQFLFLLFCFQTVVAQQTDTMLDRTLGSVVTVAVYKTDNIASKQLGFRGEGNSDRSVSKVAYKRALDLAGARGSGSGFVITYKGKPYVITNSHVIENASDEEGSISVFSVNRSKYGVRILGGDSFYDIAVLEFVGEPGPEINTVAFRDSEARLGEKVYAIGNPLGEYPYSVSDGIISAKNRVRGGMTGKFGFLQTTATVIWGNSGGPLVDASGDVLGINSQIAFTRSPSGNDVWLSQINFALDGTLSKRLVENIIENNGRVERAYAGIELSQEQVYHPGTRRMEEGKVVISGILNDAPSAAKLRQYAGMELVRVNEMDIRTVEDALYQFERTTPGQELTLQVDDGKMGRQVVKITTTTLRKRQLESIAAYFLGSIPDIDLHSADPQVLIELKEEKVQQYGEQGFGELFNPSQTLQKNYAVLAAGVRGKNYQRMWRIDGLYDLGAALKLSGLSGILDMYVAENSAGSEKIKVFRRNFSDQRNTKIKRIWY